MDGQPGEQGRQHSLLPGLQRARLPSPHAHKASLCDARAAPSSSGLRERRGSAASGSRSWAGLVSGGTFTELGPAQHSPTPELQSLSLLAPEPSPGQELSPGSLCLLLRGKPACSSPPWELPRLDSGWSQPDPLLLRDLLTQALTSSFQLCWASAPRCWNEESIFISLPGLSSWMAGPRSRGSIWHGRARIHQCQQEMSLAVPLWRLQGREV